jgi:3-hydroxyacyl-[acyl-carrier-protein] dehydratase
VTLDRWTPVDVLLEIEPGKGARGVRNVPNTLAILDSHFPKFPVLPGVLMLGSVGTLASAFMRAHTGRTWRLAGAEQVRYRHWVQPGDQLEMSVELKEQEAASALLSATGRVKGRVVMTARSIRLVPTDEVPQRGSGSVVEGGRGV